MENKRYDAYGNEFQLSENDFNFTQSDKKIHDKKFETKATTFGKDALKRFCKNKSSVVAFFIIMLLMLLSFLLPVVTPYNIDTNNPNVKELKMLPKLFEYKPTGNVDTNPLNTEDDWKTFWNGTQILTNVQYDPELKLPYNTDQNGERKYYSKDVVKELDYYEHHVNDTAKGSVGGYYIFRTVSNKTGKIELTIFQALDYSDFENFTLELNLNDTNLHNNDDFKELNADQLGTYRIIVKHVEGKETKEFVLKDWSNDHSDYTVNISEAMKANSLSEIKQAQIVIQVQNLEEGFGYLAIESLYLKSDSNETVTIEKMGDYSKKDVLNMMSMTNEPFSDTYDDAAQKLRYAKLNTGVYPIQYWRTTAKTNKIYQAYVYLCDFLLDTYENTYGVRQTQDVTEAVLEQYEKNGWCKYDYWKDENGVYQYTFEILDPEKCPVVGEIDVQFSEFVTTKNGEEVTIISQQITSNVVMYKFLGYDHAPKYLLGTDDRGFDIIVYSFNGLKKSFLIAIIVSAICLSFGLVWGSISGYFGGNVDLFMERFCEILSGVPSTVVITLVVLLLGDTILTFGLALCMTGWLGIAGRTRTQFYRFKGREYILASRTLGSSDMRLIFRHILPNSLGTIVTSSVLSIPSVIFSESSLSYLGILKGSNSFGSVLSHNQTFIATRPMLIVFPAIIISLIMISFNLFGNGLRDALNPSLKGSE